MKQLKNLFLGALFAPLVAMAAGGHVQLDRAPTEKFRDALAIQRGAQMFVTGDMRHFGHLCGTQVEGVLVLPLRDAFDRLVAMPARRTRNPQQ